jgi:hypothetical protein
MLDGVSSWLGTCCHAMSTSCLPHAGAETVVCPHSMLHIALCPNGLPDMLCIYTRTNSLKQNST